MDQWKSYILANTQQTFYVHDGSTEIVYIIEIEAKYFMSMMDQWKTQQTFYVHHAKYFMFMMDQRKSYILAKAWQTFYVHDGSIEIVYIIKIEAKYFMSMMDQWKLQIIIDQMNQEKLESNKICKMDQRKQQTTEK